MGPLRGMDKLLEPSVAPGLKQLAKKICQLQLLPSSRLYVALIKFLMLANAFATFYMTGLIWFVQIVHYPLFEKVGAQGWGTYHQMHTERTGLAVGPMMLVEMASAICLFWYRPAGIPLSEWMAGFAVLIVIWLSTLLLQIPAHELLSKTYAVDTIDRLVTTNWLRTIGWTFRSGLLLKWFWHSWLD